MSPVALVAFLEHSKYVLLLVGSFIEGPAVMMSGGILWRLGQTTFIPTLASLVAGDFMSDVAWYGLGYFAGRSVILRWGRLVHLTPIGVGKIERQFNARHNWFLIISKVTGGFGFSIGTLIMAGVLRISFNTYIAIQFFGGLVWVLFMMLIGYNFGNVLALIPRDMQIVLALAGACVFFFVLKYVGAQLSRAEGNV